VFRTKEIDVVGGCGQGTLIVHCDITKIDIIRGVSSQLWHLCVFLPLQRTGNFPSLLNGCMCTVRLRLNRSFVNIVHLLFFAGTFVNLRRSFLLSHLGLI
jgi:hypothetical protein